MRTRSRTRPRYQPEMLPLVVGLWVTRLLVPLGAHNVFLKDHGFANDEVAKELGLGGWDDQCDEQFDKRAALTRLRRLHKDCEELCRDEEVSPFLRKNVERLRDLVGLTDTDCRILEFAVLLHCERLLDDAADWLGPLSSNKLGHALSVLLDLPVRDVDAALAPTGGLARSGLVRVDRNPNLCLKGKLDLLSSSFADTVLTTDTDPVALLKDTVSVGLPPELSLEHYAHIAKPLSVLRPYLKRSLETGRKGVNVLLHGAPGTGKSQLARVLAKDLNCELFEVSSEDSDGDPVTGERRLRALRAAQSFFSRRRALVVFDEAQDALDDGDKLFGRKSTAQVRKAWVNRTLEEAAVPSLWLTNSILGVDPAFIRRFDLIFELPVPPTKQRAEILKNACQDLLPESVVARIAKVEELAPAVVTRAASVAHSIRADVGDAGAAEAFELLISQTLEAQGHKPLSKQSGGDLPEIYDPAFINSDIDLARVADGLGKIKQGRVCLYGPPGTGKSAFGRWLAEQIGMPLLIRRGSDLLSKYVGGTERNIAAAFREATSTGAVLMLDEVDSFLQDRRGAHRSWELSLVNEMLTQMECFDGVFIASTNLVQGLDQAALRRYDFKAKLDYLKPDQATELLCRYCIKFQLPMPTTELRERVARRGNVTPGDFAVAVRQHRLRPVTSAAELVDSIVAECRMKEGSRAAIGFC